MKAKFLIGLTCSFIGCTEAAFLQPVCAFSSETELDLDEDTTLGTPQSMISALTGRTGTLQAFALPTDDELQITLEPDSAIMYDLIGGESAWSGKPCPSGPGMLILGTLTVEFDSGLSLAGDAGLAFVSTTLDEGWLNAGNLEPTDTAASYPQLYSDALAEGPTCGGENSLLASLTNGAAWDPDATLGTESRLVFGSVCRDSVANSTRSLFYGDIGWD